MKESDVIKRLRNDDDYYGDFGRQFLSNSDIECLLTNPKNFGVPREDDLNLAGGRLFHQLLFEPKKAESVITIDASTRNTNIYKDAIASTGLKFIMLRKEAELYHRLASIMKSNIAFFDEIYAEGNEFEVPAIGEIFGHKFKGKADVKRPKYIIDAKTTSDIQKFKYSAKTYNYDSQAFIYSKIFGGVPVMFFVIDKETEQLGVFRCSQQFMESGEAKVKAGLEVYDRFFGPNSVDDIEDYFIEEELF